MQKDRKVAQHLASSRAYLFIISHLLETSSCMTRARPVPSGGSLSGTQEDRNTAQYLAGGPPILPTILSSPSPLGATTWAIDLSQAVDRFQVRENNNSAQNLLSPAAPAACSSSLPCESIHGCVRIACLGLIV